GLVVVAVVAGAFAAGRATQATPAAVQAAPSTTEPDTGQPDQGLATRGDSFYNWPSRQRAGLTLTLERIEVSERRTTITVGVGGLGQGQSIAGLHGITVTDRAGRQLLGTGPAEPADTERDAGGDQHVARVTVPGGIGDLAAVAAMTVQGVTVASRLDELAKGTLVDPHLSASDVRPPPATCGGCRLDVRCTRCRTMRVVAFAYRHADVVVVLAPKGPRPASVLGGGSPQVLVSDDLTSSDVQPAVSAAPDGTTAVRFEARALDVGGGARRAHGFSIDVQDNLAREVQGPWQMSTQP
ncbi:MAG TPA: hypothetical protein VEP73_12070, partial [Actinomycetota bacterium]|nr:hypothetical protein [Actinomycetota bacterium]